MPKSTHGRSPAEAGATLREMVDAIRLQLPGLPDSSRADVSTRALVDAACADLGVDAPDASLYERARLCYDEVR